MIFEIDKGHDQPIYLQCDLCTHRNIGKNNCKAFPEGIPKAIFTNQVYHTKIYKDQKNDIVFEPIKPDKA